MSKQAAKPTISYSYDEAAIATGISVSALRAAVRNGEVPVHYPTPGKPVFLPEDLTAWIAAAPTERAS